MWPCRDDDQASSMREYLARMALSPLHLRAQLCDAGTRTSVVSVSVSVSVSMSLVRNTKGTAEFPLLQEMGYHS